MSPTSGKDVSPTFRTLKQSLDTTPTRPLFPRSRSRSLPERASPHLENNERLQGAVFTAEAPPSAGEIAFATLQYLPVPTIVLSSRKQVILANEAFKSLLATVDDEENAAMSNGASKQTAGADTLHGRSLSQLGIQVLVEGDQAWTSFDDFLDDVVERLPADIADEQEESQDVASSARLKTHTYTTPPPSRSQVMDAPSDSEGRALVHDISAKVLIKPRLPAPRNDSSSRSVNQSETYRQASGKMTTSIWALERQRYFTLTFQTTNDSWGTLPTMPNNSRVVSGRLDLATVANLSSFPQIPLMNPYNFSRLSLPRTSSPGSMPPKSTFSWDTSRGDPSAHDRTSRLKDAIIDTIDIPIMAMWRDGSLAVYNKAVARLAHDDVDLISTDADKVLSRFRVYTEDFERELEQSEFPIIKLCREQKTFKGFRVGTIDSKGTKRVFEISGDGIHDQQTGEFLAGICALTDLTRYVDVVKAQSEQDERKFQLICEYMPQTVWTCKPDGRVDYYSPKWYEFTGWTPGHLEGEDWSRVVHPEDRAEFVDAWNRCLATGADFVSQCRAQRHDGEWRWMQCRVSPLREKSGRILKWFGTNTDTHDLVEARLSAKRFQDHLLNVITHASVTVWTVDKDLKLTLLEGKLMWEDESPDFMRQVLGKDLFHAFGKHQHKKDWGMFKELIEAILRGEISGWDDEHELVEGKGRWYRTKLAPIRGAKRLNDVIVPNAEGNIEGLMGCSVDVTEMKERERALRSQEKENLRLAAAEHAAKETSRMKGQFLANMSHEIRTPIAGVLGMVEILLNTDLDCEQREWAETIHRSANGLLTVINDVLDFSKVESGKLDLEEIPFSLAILVDDICKMLSFAAEQKGIDFKNEIHASIGHDLIVLGDPGRLRQILTNLLTNSIKFTSKGYVKIAIRCEEESSESIKIFFTVKDTGIGIAEEVQKRLFKPFSQADSSTARKYGGTGLGLTICKSLVDLMHGEIELESELGRGSSTTFWICFHKPQFRAGVRPLNEWKTIPGNLEPEPSMTEQGYGQQHKSDSHLKDTSATPKPLLANPALDAYRLLTTTKRPSRTEDKALSVHDLDRKRIHILVVEDNAVNQTIALRLIKKFGFSVSAVWNGKEALDYLLEPTTPDHPKPDVILMDVQMPVLDGYRATHNIRHHGPFSTLPDIRALPIVAMTASAIQGEREKCVRAGMNDYLSKPVKGPILEDMLLKWALESKRHKGLLEFAEWQSTDHSSICDHPSSCSASDVSPSIASLGPNEQSPIVSIEVPQASASIARRRGLQRDSSLEQANYLRNDKLLAASEPKPWKLHLSLPSPKPYMRHGPGSTPLTQENMARLNRETREHEFNPFECNFTHAGEISDSDSLTAASQAALPQAVGESAYGSPATPAQTESLGVVLEGKLVRNESYSSQVTIRALNNGD